ncbi:hypothetical protein BDV40DRAFT_267455 [Aspergillus tamarii]|uniref:Secreted protein n=1 Tax=Aspergillus tamarii TaxID=41984 RepID=A0A5N6USC3_ASPTM|nr:hypothetical protein BDV40DRAFT_267455 [Aspergillus tamarii]
MRLAVFGCMVSWCRPVYAFARFYILKFSLPPLVSLVTNHSAVRCKVVILSHHDVSSPRMRGRSKDIAKGTLIELNMVMLSGKYRIMAV